MKSFRKLGSEPDDRLRYLSCGASQQGVGERWLSELDLDTLPRQSAPPFLSPLLRVLSAHSAENVPPTFQVVAGCPAQDLPSAFFAIWGVSWPESTPLAPSGQGVVQNSTATAHTLDLDTLDLNTLTDLPRLLKFAPNIQNILK